MRFICRPPFKILQPEVLAKTNCRAPLNTREKTKLEWTAPMLAGIGRGGPKDLWLDSKRRKKKKKLTQLDTCVAA